jgi:hypothetical protein
MFFHFDFSSETLSNLAANLLRHSWFSKTSRCLNMTNLLKGGLHVLPGIESGYIRLPQSKIIHNVQFFWRTAIV